MKSILCIALSLVSVSSHGEESGCAGWVRRQMQSHGWKTEKVTFEEIGKSEQLVIIKRSGESVGYYFQESVWERRDLPADALTGVTKIIFGYDQPSAPKLFQIDDQVEIGMWIAAYRNHTEFERRFGCFIPTTASAGFGRTRSEFQFGGACMCSLALRFYVEDREVLELNGHFHEQPEIDSRMRNLMLHELAKAKLPKEPVKAANDDEAESIDPFAEEPKAENKGRTRGS